MSEKETRKTFLHDKSAARKKRKKPTLSEDTLTMQQRYVEQGYFSVAEIAYLMANDSYEDLLAIEEEYGLVSQEYSFAHARATNAIKTALPYFAIQMKAELIQNLGGEITAEGVEDALAKMIAERNNK